LKELEANKLITRTVHDTSPVLIEYKVSPYSETIHPLVAEMEKWGQNHREKIKEK
jgi:DNA-binding HxlR family transcriptional regulator